MEPTINVTTINVTAVVTLALLTCISPGLPRLSRVLKPHLTVPMLQKRKHSYKMFAQLRPAARPGRRRPPCYDPKSRPR